MSRDTSTSKIPPCEYCGNNPVNHTASAISQNILIFALPLATCLSFFTHPKLLVLLHNTFATWSMDLLRLCRLTSFQDDISKACSDRSKVIWEEAKARGIPMEQMTVSGKPVEQYRARLFNRWHYFASLPIPLFLEQHSYVWMDSKAKVKRVLKKEKVPVPRGGGAFTQKQAIKLFNEITKPVIVKPAHGSRGRHTSTNINTLEDLIRAYKIAKQLCVFVVVEEHLYGSVYRGTYIGGEIVGVLRGDPPRVTGDGVATIEKLIVEKNEQRPERVKEFLVKDVVLTFLEKQGYTLETVLPKGKTIDLIEKIGLSYGGDACEEFPITHPKLLAELKRAGDILNAPVIGFDFISEDITKDPSTVRWGIIEANSMPFIDLHHDPRTGTPINAAAKVWDLWNKK